jgi:hypothetical protein
MISAVFSSTCKLNFSNHWNDERVFHRSLDSEPQLTTLLCSLLLDPIEFVHEAAAKTLEFVIEYLGCEAADQIDTIVDSCLQHLERFRRNGSEAQASDHRLHLLQPGPIHISLLAIAAMLRAYPSSSRAYLPSIGLGKCPASLERENRTASLFDCLIVDLLDGIDFGVGH